MNLTGKEVSHITFGRGVITNLSDNIIHIDFGGCVKKFLFPDAFGGFLTFESTQDQKLVKQLLRRKEIEEKKKEKAIHEAHEKLRRLNCLKINPESQGVFGLTVNKPKDVFSTWSLFTGRYISGYSKGEPRLPSRLCPNSACIITYLPQGKSERNRQILGLFMVSDDFFGSECTDGMVYAHQDYRIKLDEGKTLRYWDYFNVGDNPPSWGSVEIKYISNLVVRKMLYDIRESYKDTPGFEMADGFYKYFCRINRLEDDPRAKAKSKEKEQEKQQNIQKIQ
jgi:hypothetical protein